MSAQSPREAEQKVVVVGGGFGGLQAVKQLGRRPGVRVTLVDRHNYHLFQPLSYQVATGALAAGDIAVPLRHIFKSQKRVEVVMGEVAAFDLERHQLLVKADVPDGMLKIPYDTLIVAAGSDYSYFGHEKWRAVALEVKSLDSALEVRGRILHAFEAAEVDPSNQESWLTFVVVGAGPTGVEMAGQIAELARDTLPGEFRHIDPGAASVLLIETADRVLGAFPAPLPRRAAGALKRLGVTLMLGQTVVDVRADGVELEDRAGTRSHVRTRTVVWAAGVEASPLAKMLGEASGGEVDRSGRLAVEADLTLPGHPEVLALGDMVRVLDSDTRQAVTYPGLAPVAMQQGRYAARLVASRAAGKQSSELFRYRDKGTLATIGRSRAVADVGGLRFSGFLAWAAWLVVHIFYLIGFESRLVVIVRWAYSYLTRGRGSRLITDAAQIPPVPELRDSASGTQPQGS